MMAWYEGPFEGESSSSTHALVLRRCSQGPDVAQTTALGLNSTKKTF